MGVKVGFIASSCDSPALHAEQSRIPNQTRKEPRFSLWNTRESPGTLSQNEMNTDAPQECKIARCTPNQPEMKPVSPSLEKKRKSNLEEGQRRNF